MNFFWEVNILFRMVVIRGVGKKILLLNYCFASSYNNDHLGFILWNSLFRIKKMKKSEKVLSKNNLSRTGGCHTPRRKSFGEFFVSHGAILKVFSPNLSGFCHTCETKKNSRLPQEKIN